MRNDRLDPLFFAVLVLATTIAFAVSQCASTRGNDCMCVCQEEP